MTNAQIKAIPIDLEGFRKYFSEEFERAKSLVKKVEAKEGGSVLLSMNDLQLALENAVSLASLYEAAHPDKSLRSEAEKMSREGRDFGNSVYTDPKLYEALKSVSKENLNPEAQTALTKTLLDFERAGAEKEVSVRDRLRQLVREEIAVGQEFDRNLKDDVRSIQVSAEDLDGLPDDYRISHQLGADGKIRITTQYPDYMPFMKYAKKAELRRKLYMEFTNRGYPLNDTLLKKLIALRAERAALLGFKDWASYALADKMIESPTHAWRFLEDMAQASRIASERDYQKLLERKRKDEAGAEGVEAWEAGYYRTKVLEEEYELNQKELREYFETKATILGALRVFERLFEVEFVSTSLSVWHEEVSAFEVRRNKEVIGNIFLDLHPREGKFGHAACFEIRPGIRGRQLPMAALLCNFSREAMDHGEVTTFFHEFGHVMHYVLASGLEWANLAGFSGEWDFVEAPSQMLEEWAWDGEVLNTFARHRKTGEPIPEAWINKLRVLDEFGKGYDVRVQVFYATFSLRLHELKEIDDVLSLMQELQSRYSPFAYVPGTHFYANFGHLKDYTALYYTYLWSNVMAKDFFTVFQGKGVFDREALRRYREEILVPGASRSAADRAKRFLDRDTSISAFVDWLRK